MANPRNSPYIWVTWLSKIMSGDTSCHWQAWFQSQNQLTEKQSNDFDIVEWKINHTKMLTQLKEKLIEEGHSPSIEHSISYRFPDSGVVIAGKSDCIVENEDSVIVFDCKTGKERVSDQIQVMLYMFLLDKCGFSRKKIVGKVVYEDRTVEIPNLSEDFEGSLNFFVNILSSSEPPTKNSGDDCKFCPITINDCSERV